MEEKRKEDFFTKQDYHDKLRVQAQAEKDEAQRLYLEQQELLEKRRQLILKQFKEDEEVRQLLMDSQRIQYLASVPPH